MSRKIQKMKLGTYLVKNGFISLDQAQKILEVQQKGDDGSNKQRFGRIAINLGYLSEKMLNRIVLEKERKEFGV